MSTRAAAKSIDAERPSLAPVKPESTRNQADDPDDGRTGDLDELAAELAGLDPGHADSELWLDPVLPPEFDLFEPNPDAVRKVRDKGRDPTIVQLHIHPIRRGIRQAAVKRLRPEGVTYARLCQVLPPGRYDVVGYTEDRFFLGAKRFTVNGDQVESLQGVDDLDTLGGSAAVRPGFKGSPGDRILYELAMQALKGPRSQDSGGEMREAMAGMVKLITAQAQLQQAELASRLKMLETEQTSSRRETTGQLGLVKTIFELVDRRTPKGKPGGAAKFEDFVGALQLGMHFQQMRDGGKVEPDADWIERLAIPALEELGPGIVTIIAALFPDDKAKPIMEMLEQHLRTREAEAKAAAAAADNDRPTWTTTGETVPEDQ